jgi:preprotein translocase subunit SecY
VVLLKNFINIFNIAELRKKIFFTLGALIIYRLGGHIPVVGINIDALRQFMQHSTSLGGLLQYLDLFSGGALSQCTIFALGVGPYVSASIMMQMLGMTIPQFEQLLKEGEYGRKIINQYTRYLTFFVAIFQSSVYATALEMNNMVLTPGWGFRLSFILSLVVGTIFVMWLGEQIGIYGIGNGSSMIIFAGIVCHFPEYIFKVIELVREGLMDGLIALLILIVFVGVTAAIVYLERGERKIPVQYSRRIVGNRVYGGQSSYIPFRINAAGVMPVIFAGAFLQIPMFVFSWLGSYLSVFKVAVEYLMRGGAVFNIIQFVLIIFFSFFYTALVFNPEELAENIKKQGGFIPGVRPGRKTAEYFNYILTRIGLIGAIYLAILALFPNLLNIFIAMPFYMSGTALLIVVGVALETAAQIESYLIEHRYEGLLTAGRFKSRSLR